MAEVVVVGCPAVSARGATQEAARLAVRAKGSAADGERDRTGMPQYRMKVRHVTEEVLDFVVEADSDVHAHQSVDSESTKDRPVTSREVRTTVIECHRIIDTL